MQKKYGIHFKIFKNADERLFEHQENISVINTFDLHMLK